MTTSGQSPADAERYAAAAEALLQILIQTESEITHLRDALRKQLEALTQRRPEALHETTDELTKIGRRLEELLRVKAQQSELISGMVDANTTSVAKLAGALPWALEIETVAEGITRRAREANQIYDDLAFALQFAAQLDGELLRSVWFAQAPSESTVYTSEGATDNSRQRNAVVNRFG